MPNSIADIGDVDGRTPARPTRCPAHHPPRGGTVGRGAVCARLPDFQSQLAASLPQPGHPTYNNRIRAGYSLDITDIVTDPARRGRRQLQLVRPLSAGLADCNRLGEVGDLDFLDPAGAFLLPVERMRRYVTPADINGTGRVLQ